MWEFARDFGGGVMVLMGVMGLVLLVVLVADWARDFFVKSIGGWKVVIDFAFARKNLLHDREELACYRAKLGQAQQEHARLVGHVLDLENQLEFQRKLHVK
jgi:hypothetical protein